MSKNLIYKEEIKFSNTINNGKMINFDDVTKTHERAYLNWHEIPDHPLKILIAGGSGSWENFHCFMY